jgi:hypothetical protein
MYPWILSEPGAHHCTRSHTFLINSTLQGEGQYMFVANQFVQHRHPATYQLTLTKQTINAITVQTTTMRHSCHRGLLRIITATYIDQQHGHMSASTFLARTRSPYHTNKKRKQKQLQTNWFRWVNAKDTWMFRLSMRKT